MGGLFSFLKPSAAFVRFDRCCLFYGALLKRFNEIICIHTTSKNGSCRQVFLFLEEKDAFEIKSFFVFLFQLLTLKKSALISFFYPRNTGTFSLFIAGLIPHFFSKWGPVDVKCQSVFDACNLLGYNLCIIKTFAHKGLKKLFKTGSASSVPSTYQEIETYSCFA